MCVRQIALVGRDLAAAKAETLTDAIVLSGKAAPRQLGTWALMGDLAVRGLLMDAAS